MKLSDYIVSFLKKKGVTEVYGYPGGMVTHLMDSLSKSGAIRTHLNYHEQASAFCVVGHAQVKHTPSVAFATSGPGATNLITGICDAWFDSIPAVFITGQVNAYEGKGTLNVRQLGFQETDVVSMVRGVTKYAVYVENPEQIRFELEKAFHLACSKRPGPVLLDIPMNVFRAEIDAEHLPGFEPEADGMLEMEREAAAEIIKRLQSASRPLVIAGSGIRQSAMQAEFEGFINKAQVPVVTSMPAVDVLPDDNPYKFGFIGAYGKRSANMLVDKADLIVTLGTRLDKRQTGNDLKNFAVQAQIIRVDVDAAELEHAVKQNELSFCCDLKELCPILQREAVRLHTDRWLEICTEIRKVADLHDDTPQTAWLRRFSQIIPEDIHVITTDVGQNQVWAAQAMSLRKGQRLLFSSGHGAMGYSLPAAIGACCALREKVVSLNGDGGIQMNIQELQTIARERLSVKIVVLNNASLGMIRHFQEMYFSSNYMMTVENQGYAAPDFAAVARAYGIPGVKVSLEDDPGRLRDLLDAQGPALIEVDVGNVTYVKPKSVYNLPLSRQTPFIDEDIQKYLMEL